MTHLLLTLLLLLVPMTDTTCSSSIVLDEPFVIEPNDTISTLYDVIGTKVSSLVASRGLSIIFGGKLILNEFNHRRTIMDIGMNETSNDIQIIRKPDFVALLEMTSDIDNKESIPWFDRAMQCVFSPLTNQCINTSDLGRGLHCDDNGILIAVALSHLNLTGTINLESLPQSVRSLDLSFNDLMTLDLDGLRGKSVVILNVENNRRCHINTECFSAERFQLNLEKERIWTISELRVSSNQIFPWITDPMDKDKRIKNWLNGQDHLARIIVNRSRMYRRWRLKGPLALYSGMLRVIEGVTNKEVIPWYRLFVNGWVIQADQWREYGVAYKRKFNGLPSRYKFFLCSLGLCGHIDLGHLPKNVMKMDLSNNDLSSISFADDGSRRSFNLRVLDIRNNDNLRVDLMRICPSSRGCCLDRLVRLSISSNQLEINNVVNGIQMTMMDALATWFRTTTLREFVVDNIVLINERVVSLVRAHSFV